MENSEEQTQQKLY